MAIYHCSIKNISRGKGKSAVAAAAYRAGAALTDAETGIKHNYTSKSEVAYSQIILPANAPTEYQNRETLWNAVQKAETQSNARLAREWEVALPHELTIDQGKELTAKYAQSLADEGMCIDYSIHWKDGNHHAHIMGTTRPIGKDGKWAAKERKSYKLDAEGKKIPVIDPKTGRQKIGARGRKMWQRETVQANDWNRREKVEEWRKRWADYCNQYLTQEQQLDHRSYKRQGVDKTPTVHEGYAARQMEQQGNLSELCQLNRDIKIYNRLKRQLNKLRRIKGVMIDARLAKYRGAIIAAAGAAKPNHTGANQQNNIIGNQTRGSIPQNRDLEQLGLGAASSAEARSERDAERARRAEQARQRELEAERSAAARKQQQAEREAAARASKKAHGKGKAVTNDDYSL
jgi:hypothetical protein